MIRKKNHISVSFIGPSLLYGGAERWIYNLVKYCMSEHIKWIANIITCPFIDATMLNLISEFVPTYFNNQVSFKNRSYNISLHDEINNICEKSDIIIGWELDDKLIKTLNTYNSKVINVLHRNDLSLKQSIRSEHFICAVSPYWKNNINRNDIHIIPNGIDIKRCTPRIARKEIRRIWNIREDNIAVGFIGRISKEKNCTAVSRAISTNRNGLKGIFYGSRTKQSEIIINKMNKQTNNISFYDPVENIGDVLNGLDVLIIPSFSEACPYVLLEAMLSKTPVVTSINPLVEDLESKFGKLTERIDPEDSGENILSAIHNAIKIEEDTLNRAKNIVVNQFNMEVFLKNWEKYLLFVYDQIMIKHIK